MSRFFSEVVAKVYPPARNDNDVPTSEDVGRARARELEAERKILALGKSANDPFLQTDLEPGTPLLKASDEKPYSWRSSLSQKHGTWYSFVFRALPKLFAVDLVFVSFLILWSFAMPNTKAYIGSGCAIAILAALGICALSRSFSFGFVVVAMIFGTSMGHGYYCTHFAQVWSYDNKAGYTGVHAASPAKSRADAGSMAFAKTTHVDLTQPIGYKRGDVYCVAPIVDDSIDDATVNFWAVGLNCCGARDAFRCYDSLLPNARGGMVVAVENETMFHSDPLKMYKKAAEIASGQYDLKQSPDVMFVYWIYDLAGERQKILDDAYLQFLYSALIFFAFLVPTHGFLTFASDHVKIT